MNENSLKPCPICASTAVADADVAVQAYNYRPIEDAFRDALDAYNRK